MSFSAGDVARALPKKGFVREDDHHRYFYFYFQGKKTRFYTLTSGGKNDETVGDNNVRSMKRQLGLGTMKQVRELIQCTMDEAGYIAALKALGNL